MIIITIAYIGIGYIGILGIMALGILVLVRLALGILSCNHKKLFIFHTVQLHLQTRIVSYNRDYKIAHAILSKPE